MALLNTEVEKRKKSYQVSKEDEFLQTKGNTVQMCDLLRTNHNIGLFLRKKSSKHPFADLKNQSVQGTIGKLCSQSKSSTWGPFISAALKIFCAIKCWI